MRTSVSNCPIYVPKLYHASSKKQLVIYNSALPDVMTYAICFSFERLHGAAALVQQKHPLHTTPRGAENNLDLNNYAYAILM